MNSKVVSTALLLLCIMLIGFSCSERGNGKINDGSVSHNSNNHTSTKVDVSNFQISPDTAKQRIERYAEFSNNMTDFLEAAGVSSDSTKYFVYGQKVQIDELKSILESATDQHNDLYIMLGIDNVTQETDIIFSLRCDTVQCNFEPVLPFWEYFDFTRPCPQYCPEWFVNWEKSEK